MKIIHRTEHISDYPRSGGQNSYISLTIAHAGEVARISVKIDHAYSSQSHAYSELVRSGATIISHVALDKHSDPKAVAQQLVAETGVALDALAE